MWVLLCIWKWVWPIKALPHWLFIGILSTVSSFMSLKMVVICKGKAFSGQGYINMASLQDVSFYAVEDCLVMKMLCHIVYSHRVSLQNVIFYEFEDCHSEQTLCHIGYIHRISVLYIFFYALEDSVMLKMLCHIGYLQRVSLPYVLLCAWRRPCAENALPHWLHS